MKVRQHPGTGLWISSDGRVVMPPCPYIHRFKYTWTYGCKNKNGYMTVRYRGKLYYVHRLVAEVHVPNPNPEEYKEVDHKDRNPANNASSNLRWADRKMQNNNKQIVEDCLAKYGVRGCDDRNAYQRAYRAANPEFAERQNAKSRSYQRERRARDPEYVEHCRAKSRELRARDPERHRARCREWKAKQRALGRRNRTCPDGSRRWLTDEEFDARYKKSSLMAGNSV